MPNSRVKAKSITISNVWKLIEQIKIEMKDAGFESDNLSPDDGYLNLTSHHLRDFFIKHDIDPKLKYSKYYSEEQAVITLTYEWKTTYQLLERFLSPRNIQWNSRAFNGDFSVAEYFWSLFFMWCCFGQLNSVDIEKCGIWMDIFFIYQKSDNLIQDVEDSENQYKNNKFHWIIDSDTLYERCWCLHEISTRYLARRHSRIIRLFNKEPSIIQGVKNNMMDYLNSATSQEFQDDAQRNAIKLGFRMGGFRNYFGEMKAFVENDKMKLQSRILEAYESKLLFNCIIAWKVAISKGSYGALYGSFFCWILMVITVFTIPFVALAVLFSFFKILRTKLSGSNRSSLQQLRIHIAAGWFFGYYAFTILNSIIMCPVSFCCTCLCCIGIVPLSCCFQDRIQRIIENLDQSGDGGYLHEAQHGDVDAGRERQDCAAQSLPLNMSMISEIVVTEPGPGRL